MAKKPRVSARKIAIVNGDKFYIGSPCMHGHTSGKRYTTGGSCVQCNKERDVSHYKSRQSDGWKHYQKNYQKKYRADPKNQKRLTEIQMKYYIKWYYDGDEQRYFDVQAKREERTAEINAHRAEVALRKQLRQQRKQ